MNLLVLRADAGSRIGAGHVMRCLALAQAWQAAGGRAVLVSRCDSPALRGRVEEAGVRLVALGAGSGGFDHQAALGGREDRPAGAWLALDGYHFGPADHREARQAGWRLLVIDDTAHQQDYDADVLLNQNLGAEELTYHCRPSTRRLLGPRYALLRPEFVARRGEPRPVAATATKVLVTLGGADPDNITGRVLAALGRLGMPGLQARVVVGPANPHLDRLRRQAEAMACDVQLLYNVLDMPGLMAWADVAVSAAGSTCWELALLGVPAVVLVTADNQRGVAAGLAARGAAVSLGEAADLDEHRLTATLTGLLGDPNRRAALARNGRSLVDGKGAERVVAALRSHPMTTPDAAGLPVLALRPATAEDARLLWEWTNDPTVRANAFNPTPVPWESHREWLARRLASPSTRLWIAEVDGRPVGQIRYDRSEDGRSAEIGYSVAREHRGKRYATALLAQTRHEACAALGVREIVGVVFAENEASARAFRSAGYKSPGVETVRGRPCYRFTWRPEATEGT